MSLRVLDSLPVLFEQDETAWLDRMAELAREGRSGDLDLPHLADYLSDMARRDRREVESRLVVLMMHILKWGYQPDHRSRSWLSTVVEQRQELNRIAGRGVLRDHASKVLGELYPEAVERAVAETGLPLDRFPVECPYSLDQLLTIELTEAGA